MTYLEYPIILMQVYIMLYYVLKFNGIISKPFVSLGALVYFAAVIGFGLEILPKEMLSYSIVSSISILFLILLIFFCFVMLSVITNYNYVNLKHSHIVIKIAQ